MNAASCPRHGATMGYRITSDDFMCSECGFTLASAEVAMSVADLAPPPPAEPNQVLIEDAEPEPDADA